MKRIINGVESSGCGCGECTLPDLNPVARCDFRAHGFNVVSYAATSASIARSSQHAGDHDSVGCN